MRPVIAVAAPIGGGKTSLATALAARLGNASLLHYDHYERSTMESVDDLERWVENGAPIDELSVPGLADALSRLKRGDPVTDPVTGALIPAGRLIVLEMPLGREHAATAPLIDLLIWIDAPLDLALARKIREFVVDFPAGAGEADTRAFLSWLAGYLDNYLRVVGRMLEIQRERVPRHADVTLDGRVDRETLLRLALEAIRSRFPA